MSRSSSVSSSGSSRGSSPFRTPSSHGQHRRMCTEDRERIASSCVEERVHCLGQEIQCLGEQLDALQSHMEQTIARRVSEEMAAKYHEIRQAIDMRFVRGRSDSLCSGGSESAEAQGASFERHLQSNGVPGNADIAALALSRMQHVAQATDNSVAQSVIRSMSEELGSPPRSRVGTEHRAMSGEFGPRLRTVSEFSQRLSESSCGQYAMHTPRTASIQTLDMLDQHLKDVLGPDSIPSPPAFPRDDTAQSESVSDSESDSESDWSARDQDERSDVRKPPMAAQETLVASVGAMEQCNVPQTPRRHCSQECSSQEPRCDNRTPLMLKTPRERTFSEFESRFLSEIKAHVEQRLTNEIGVAQARIVAIQQDAERTMTEHAEIVSEAFSIIRQVADAKGVVEGMHRGWDRNVVDLYRRLDAVEKQADCAATSFDALDKLDRHLKETIAGCEPVEVSMDTHANSLTPKARVSASGSLNCDEWAPREGQSSQPDIRLPWEDQVGAFFSFLGQNVLSARGENRGKSTEIPVAGPDTAAGSHAKHVRT